MDILGLVETLLRDDSGALEKMARSASQQMDPMIFRQSIFPQEPSITEQLMQAPVENYDPQRGAVPPIGPGVVSQPGGQPSTTPNVSPIPIQTQMQVKTAADKVAEDELEKKRRLALEAYALMKGDQTAQQRPGVPVAGRAGLAQTLIPGLYQMKGQVQAPPGLAEILRGVRQ